MFEKLLPIQPNPLGMRLTVKVTPKAAFNRISDTIIEVDGCNVLKVYVTAPPEDNLANEAVLKLLSKSWGLPKSSLEIMSGHKDRRKVVQIKGNSLELMKHLKLYL